MAEPGRSPLARIQGRLRRDAQRLRTNAFRNSYETLNKAWFAKPGEPKPQRPPGTMIDDVFRYAQENVASGVQIESLGGGFRQPRVKPLLLGSDNPLFEQVVEDYAPRWVLRLPEGRVFQSSTVVSRDNHLIEAASFEFDVQETRDRKIFQRLTLPKPKRFEKPLVSVCTDYSANYFHFMLETVPRIALYRDSSFYEDGALYRLEKPRLKFQHEVLKALGISESQLVDPSEFPYATSPQVYATTVDQDEHIHPQMIDALRDLFLKEPPARSERRIYVERGQAPGRRIVNESDVIRHLEAYGFECVKMDGLSVYDQAQLFGSCEAVCALHGAALTNLAYVPEGGGLIELMPPNYISRYYWDIATRRKMGYCAIVGEPDAGADLTQRDNFANTFVPLSLLTKALEHLGITRADACKSN